MKESKRDREFRLSQNDDYWRWHRARYTRLQMEAFKDGWVSGFHEKYPTHEDIARFDMTTAEVDAFVSETWDTIVKPVSHASCEAHFLRYGSASWPHYVHKGLCPVCGLPRLCGGEDRKHEWRSVPQDECRRRNIFHGGRCYHVSECINCHHINAVDSSD